MIDHNEEMDFSPDIYTLIDEDGVEQAFELLDVKSGESIFISGGTGSMCVSVTGWHGGKSRRTILLRKKWRRNCSGWGM